MLTATSEADATTSVHLVGSSVAISSPAPNHTADLIFCLRHLIASPSIILYGGAKCVLEFFSVFFYNRMRNTERQALL